MEYLPEEGPFTVVDFDASYVDEQTNPKLKPGWCFWFLDQYDTIVRGHGTALKRQCARERWP